MGIADLFGILPIQSPMLILGLTALVHAVILFTAYKFMFASEVLTHMEPTKTTNTSTYDFVILGGRSSLFLLLLRLLLRY